MECLSAAEINSFMQLIGLAPYDNKTCRLEYLNKMIRCYCETIPFQNIFLLATEVPSRRALTWEEIKTQVLTGQGGFCQVLNVFFYRFLQSLNFEAHLVNSAYRQIPDTHCVIIVKNLLKNGDSYAVDVGTGELMSAVCLDFEIKSEIYRDGLSIYYFEWNEQKDHINVHFQGKTGEFKPVFSFDMKIITDLKGLQFQQIYVDPSLSIMHNQLRVIRFPPEGTLCIANQKLLKENQEEKKLDIIEPPLDTVEKFLDCIKQNFPRLDLELCKRAYLHLFNQ